MESPMKKLRILTENSLNIQTPQENNPLKMSETKEAIQEEVDENKTEEKEDSGEFLLQDAPGQYVIFPINHDDMWTRYKHLVDNFWSVTDSILQLDTSTLNYNEKQFMKRYASIFASPDSQGLVNDNFAEDFCKIIQVTEAKFFYGHQLFVQNIHYELYNKLLDLFAPENEKAKLFKIVENYEAVTNKRKWVSKWKNASFGEQIMASACLHGLLFSSLELLISWLSRRIQNAFCIEISEILNRMIIDQELQRDFSCLMISHLKNKPSKELILNTIYEAAKLEFDFLINGISIDLIDIEPDEVIQLIDKKTKALKSKMFGTFENEKKKNNHDNEKLANDVPHNTASKDNHQKLVFDEDF